jgi:hypothetical protein
LHSQFGGKFTINATAVFDYPTIGGLGEYLAAQLPDAESESGGAESAEAPEAGPESEVTSQTAAGPESNGVQAETEAPSPSDEAEASSDATA